MLHLFTDDQIADATPFQEVRTHAFGILPRDQLAGIADHLAGTTHFDETAFQWDHIDTLAPQFKRHLRPVLLAVQFRRALRPPSAAGSRPLSHDGVAARQTAQPLPSGAVPGPLHPGVPQTVPV